MRTKVSKKACSRCGELKYATEIYFNKSPLSKDGLQSWCKVCYNASKIESRQLKIKQCIYCKVWYDNIKKYFKTAASKSCTYCDAIKGSGKKLKCLQAAKIREQEKSENQMHEERMRNFCIELGVENPETIPEDWDVYDRWEHLYSTGVPDNIDISTIKIPKNRKHRKPQTKEFKLIVIQIYELQQHRCLYCNDELTSNMHLDHFIPESLGGTYAKENLVLACPDCNESKHDSLPEEWERWNGKYPVYWKGEA